MTAVETVKKAIEKAFPGHDYIIDLGGLYPFAIRIAFKEPKIYKSVEQFIFSHEFAKRFWGDELVCEIHGTPKSMEGCHHSWEGGAFVPAWQYHGPQMFLAENRLQYLAQFLLHCPQSPNGEHDLIPFGGEDSMNVCIHCRYHENETTYEQK